MFVIQADKSQLTVIEREILVKNAVNVYPVRFNFSSDWDKFAKVAVFYSSYEADSVKYSVLIDGSGMAYIPREVLLQEDAVVYVGVCGDSTTNQHLPTIVIELGIVQQSICDNFVDAEVPTPNIYQQILSELASIRADIEAGMLVGPQGIRGPRGQKGDKGDKGDPGEVTMDQVNAAIDEAIANCDCGGGTDRTKLNGIYKIQILERSSYTYDIIPKGEMIGGTYNIAIADVNSNRYTMVSNKGQSYIYSISLSDVSAGEYGIYVYS